MGLLDLPAPAFAWSDEHLVSFLPDAGRVVLWGVVGAVLTMALYKVLSPQRRLNRLAAEERDLKATLKDDSVEMTEGLASAKTLLRIALLRIGLVLPAVLIAALPILALIVWLETHYGYQLPPPGESPTVQAEPQPYGARWQATGPKAPQLEVLGPDGTVLQTAPIRAPVPVLHKRVWWNVFMDNPNGYLADDGPVEYVDIALTPRQLISFGPEWLRGWEAIFLIVLLVASIAIKVVFRIR